MIYTQEVENMCPVAQGVHHGAAPVPTEGKWVQNKEVKNISGFTHGVGWCAPQQGACKLTLNVKEGIIQEALVETIGCSGMTHSAAMAAEILPGLTVMEALNTDLVCDAINTAMRELFLQIVYGRTQSAFSEGGLAVGAGLEDLGKGLRSQVGTMYGTLAKGPRYLEMAEGYVTGIALDKDDQIIGYKFVNLGKMTDFIKKGDDPTTAYEKACGQYGRVADAVKIYDDNTISIEGHTDNVPIRYSAKYENNEVLSVYRALAVTDQLRKNKNLNPKYIKFAGRGDYIPVADNSTAEGRAQNRRVEIKIYNSFNSNVKENN